MIQQEMRPVAEVASPHHTVVAGKVVIRKTKIFRPRQIGAQANPWRCPQIQTRYPEAGLEINEIVVDRLPAITHRSGIELCDVLPRLLLGLALFACEKRCDDIASLAAIPRVSDLQTLAVIVADGGFGEIGLCFKLRVENLLAGPVAGQACIAIDVCIGLGIGRIIASAARVAEGLRASIEHSGARAVLAGKIIALLAKGVTPEQIVVVFLHCRDGAERTACRTECAGPVKARCLRCRDCVWQSVPKMRLRPRIATAVIRPGRGGIRPESGLDPNAPLLAGLDDVIRTERAHRHRAGDAARACIGALLNVDARKQIGIDEGAVGDALIALIDGRIVFGAVDRHGDATHALHAADIDIDRTATIASLARHHAGCAAEDVGRTRPTEAIDGFLRDMRDRRGCRIRSIGGRHAPT